MQQVTAQKLDEPYDYEMPKPGRLRVSGYLVDEDFENETEVASAAPPSLYSNLTVLSLARASLQEKGSWSTADIDFAPGSGASSSFSRLLNITAVQKPGKGSPSRPKASTVTLNLHQFQAANGESLGEDPDHWARLTF